MTASYKQQKQTLIINVLVVLAEMCGWWLHELKEVDGGLYIICINKLVCGTSMYYL